MHDSTCQQGRNCTACTRATRAVYAAIWNRVVRWCSETPEQPLILLVIAVWSLLTAASW